MPKPFIAVAVITNDVGQYLLTLRAKDPESREWTLISGVGASLKGLSHSEAVKDEVQFDIGTQFTGELLLSYRIQIVGAEIAYVFSGTIDESRIKINSKAALDYKWFDYEEIMQLPHIAFDNRWIIEAHYSLCIKTPSWRNSSQ